MNTILQPLPMPKVGELCYEFRGMSAVAIDLHVL